MHKTYHLRKCFMSSENAVPVGRRAPGNQSGRGTGGGAHSLLGKAVRGKIRQKHEGGAYLWPPLNLRVISGVCTRCSDTQTLRRWSSSWRCLLWSWALFFLPPGHRDTEGAAGKMCVFYSSVTLTSGGSFSQTRWLTTRCPNSWAKPKQSISSV